MEALDLDDVTLPELAAREQAWQYLEAFRDHMPGWAGHAAGVAAALEAGGREPLTSEVRDELRTQGVLIQPPAAKGLPIVDGCAGPCGQRPRS